MGSFLIDYLRWHYTTAFADILHVSKNFLRAVAEMFSITLLLKTFFKPIFRMKETYAGGFDVGELFGVIVTNTLMRVVGMVVRVVFIACGLVVLALLLVLIVATYLFWLVAPLASCVAFIIGIIFLIP